ncbi:MAG: hypothetical protein AAGD96_22780 [Chloroflexota bacterium]
MTQLQKDIALTQKLIEELTQKAQGEFEDVEILKREGIPKLFHRLRGTLEDKIAAEEKELHNAISKLKNAQESLELMQADAVLIENQLCPYKNVDSDLEALTLKSKSTGNNDRLNLSISATQTLIGIKKITGSITLGDQIVEELAKAKNELVQITQEVPDYEFFGPTRSMDLRIYLSRLKQSLTFLKRTKEEISQFDNSLMNQAVECINRLNAVNAVIDIPMTALSQLNTSILLIDELSLLVSTKNHQLDNEKLDMNQALYLLEQQWDVQGNC